MSFLFKFFLITIFIFSFSINIMAATGPEDIEELKEKVYYNVTPEKPSFGDLVKIEAQMYGTPVGSSDFVWKIAGKTFLEGVGSSRAEFTLSEKTKVDLTITTGSGVIVRKSFEFDPKKVVIIWESRTYTPPFYKGKSLYTPESNLILNAINLDQVNPLTNTYNNYTWKVDSTVKGKESGVGYSSFLHKGDIMGMEPLFKVTLSGITSFTDKQNNKSNTFNSESLLKVQTLPSEIVSYEKLPLLGVLFNKTIKPEYNLDKTETTIVSYPLYYSFSSSLSGIYEWYINDVKINNNLNELSFKKTKKGERSRLSIMIKNVASILQTKTVSYIIDTSKR